MTGRSILSPLGVVQVADLREARGLFLDGYKLMWSEMHEGRVKNLQFFFDRHP